MKAYRLVSPGEAELVEVDIPRPGPGEVLLKVTAAGVCHSDLHIIDMKDWPVVPMTFGHEVCGRIADLGTGVEDWNLDEDVIAYLCWGCGRCRQCAAGYENACEMFPRSTVLGPGLGADGGMAEFVTVPARFLMPLGGLDPVNAAPLTDAALTPFHAITQAANLLTPASTTLVMGVGGLGHMAIQLLKAMTGTRIIAADVDSSRLEQAAQLGAHDTITSDANTANTLLEMTGGVGADVVFDLVGADPTMRTASGCIASYGKIVVVGLAGGVLPIEAAIPPDAMPWGIDIFRPYAGTRANLHDVLKLAQRGDIEVETTAYPLSEAADVFAKLSAGQVTGRAVLVP